MFRQNVHDNTLQIILQQLKSYLRLHPVARVRSCPFQMRLGDRIFGPDIQVIKNQNPHLKPYYMAGPADVCFEIVDERTSRYDHGEKLDYYERYGVPELWLIDIHRREVRCFWYHPKAKHYFSHPPDAQQYLHSQQLDGFRLYVPRLWHAMIGLITLPTAADDSDQAPQSNRLVASPRG